MSVDSAQRESLSTPMRAQRCLFGTQKSSCKNIIHNSGRKRRKSDSEDSDIGPMSPLTFSDQSPSSCNSSPRYCHSPVVISQELSSPLSSRLSWDRLSPRTRSKSRDMHVASFNVFNKLTMPVRQSPRRKLLSESPKSSPKVAEKNLRSQRTPDRSEQTIISDEIIPETPQRNFGREIQNGFIETPSKSNNPDYRLITPMGSESKPISVPKLNKRKSIFLETAKNSSPGRTKSMLKRHALETLTHQGFKLLRTEDNSSIPKARAALFQEKTNDSKFKEFTLSTKTFYSSSEKKENLQRLNIKQEIEQKKQRRSLPPQNTHSRKTFRRHTFGKINAGVSHGIKRPKSKSIPDLMKKKSPSETKHVQHEKPVRLIDDNETDSPIIPTGHSPSPEIDPTKRFFKSKPSLGCRATIIVNNKIKLNVTNGKIVLSQKNVQGTRQLSKRRKLADISFDTTDLTVDEPEMEASVRECNVENILKVLEDDWGDDEYDTMETLNNGPLVPASPMRPMIESNDVMMSPSSELSNLTSTMNIDDVTAPTTTERAMNTLTTNNGMTTQKYYPLFTKGYVAKTPVENGTTKLVANGIKGLNWQLSTKESDGQKQYQLDVGQKRFGATQCTECGIIYQIGEPEDEMAHLNYHNTRNTLKFAGWKTERVIFNDPIIQSRIILIEPEDSKQCWNKVTSILAVVDKDLGLVDAELSEYRNKKVYMYIRDKTVLGVLVAEPIKTANRMIPELLELDCCTAESTPAKCGINVIWTAMSHRKQGIATKLVDILRAQFYYGFIMAMDDIAFSIPTPSGKKFAEKYTKTRNFKVYS